MYTKLGRTPYGEKKNINDCIIPLDDAIINAISRAAIGSWQKYVVEEILRDGYFQPILKGRAARYRGKYDRSLNNLKSRINAIIKENLRDVPLVVVFAPVGPRGGFGIKLVKDIHAEEYL